jgi:DNA-directed RNA polymerase omega subunit
MSVETKAPESQFAYVVVASRRARQLMAGAPPLIDNPRTLKATRIATEELDLGVLEFELPEKASQEDKEGKRRK